MRPADNIHHIDDLETPELAPYRTLRRPMDHIREGIFVAEGEKVVRRLLDSSLQVVSLLLTPEWYDQLGGERIIELRDGAKIYVAEKRVLETIVGYNLHQGIMAVGKIPGQQPLDRVIAGAPKPSLLVALDGLVNAENVGVVVRNCVAFGVHAIIVGETSSSPYLRRAVRNSMGAVFRLPIVQSDHLATSLSELRERHQMNIVAAHPHERATIHAADLKGDCCVVFGNEGGGISEEVLARCSERVGIPMMNGTDSLNVASASAVFLYEVSRQRRPAS